MSNLLHGFSRQNRQAEALRRKMEDAEAWMQVLLFVPQTLF